MAEDAPRTLNDYTQWKDSLRNFEWLNRHAPGATDLDVVIERHGQFLVLEAKHWHAGIRMPLGQHIALCALARVECFSVYLIGEAPEDTDWPYRVMRYTPETRGVVSPRSNRPHFPPFMFDRFTQDDLGQLVEEWIRGA